MAHSPLSNTDAKILCDKKYSRQQSDGLFTVDGICNKTSFKVTKSMAKFHLSHDSQSLRVNRQWFQCIQTMKWPSDNKKNISNQF